MIDELGLTGLVREFAGNCVLKERTDNRVHLVLRPAQQHLLQTNMKDKLQKVIADNYGAEVKLIINVEEPETQTPIEQKVQAEQDLRDQAKSSFQQDPFVREMQDAFNASIDQKSIQPR